MTEKLHTLLDLQAIDMQLDEIIKLRGALPEEVADLQDNIEALRKKCQETQTACQYLAEDIAVQRSKIKDTERLVERYKDQQMEVRNNREYDAITKAIELQELEIQLIERTIKKHYSDIDSQKEAETQLASTLANKQQALVKKEEALKAVMEGNQEQEQALYKQRKDIAQTIEATLLQHYEHIRKNVRNKRAVAVIERSACSGCFNVVPPQLQLDIQDPKDMIYCEHCGRIMAPSPKAMHEALESVE